MPSLKHQNRKDKNLTIATVKAQDLIKIQTIEKIIIDGYNKTNKKFNINFQGSKGYINHIEIDCEGNLEKQYNRVYLEEYSQNNRIIIKYKNGNLKTFRMLETKKDIDEKFEDMQNEVEKQNIQYNQSNP